MRLSINRDQPRERKQSRCYRECVAQTANRAGDNSIRIQLRCHSVVKARHYRNAETSDGVRRTARSTPSVVDVVRVQLMGPGRSASFSELVTMAAGMVFRLLSSFNLSQHLATIHAFWRVQIQQDKISPLSPA
jgi:hypothetical protein